MLSGLFEFKHIACDFDAVAEAFLGEDVADVVLNRPDADM